MLRTSLAILAGKLTRHASRLRGGGSALPGLVAERLDPAILSHALGSLKAVVVVSGTNGKTTSTKMVVAILREHGVRVFTNPTGSNFTRGVMSSLLERIPLSGRLDADVAVVELDEAHSLHFAEAVAPTHALLLNVARDQLDRFAEIDYTAGLLTTLASHVTTGVVLNRDDSFITRAAESTGEGVAVRYFGLHPDVVHRLGELQEADVREGGTPAPEPSEHDGLLQVHDERQFSVHFGVHGAAAVGPLELRQRGLAAMINATAATSMARQVLGEGFNPQAAQRALERVTPPFGRGEVIDAGGQPLELVLVKNPAGFTVALGTYGTTPVTSMIAINDNYADGRDVSWLYDVSFESLREGGVALTSGVRAYDMALRLQHDGVATCEVEPDLERALDRFLDQHGHGPTRIFCTYTAMMTLRRLLAQRFSVPHFGEDAA